MADREKKSKRRGRHAEGSGKEAAPRRETRPPEAAGRQVFPPVEQPPSTLEPQPFQVPPTAQPSGVVPQPAQPQPEPPDPSRRQTEQMRAAPIPPGGQPLPPESPATMPEPPVPRAPQDEARRMAGRPVAPPPPPPEPSGEQAGMTPGAQPTHQERGAEPPAAAPHEAARPDARGYPPPEMVQGPGYVIPPPWYAPYGVPQSPYFGFPGAGQAPQFPVVPGAPPGVPQQVTQPHPGEGVPVMPTGGFIPPGGMPMAGPPPGAYPPGTQPPAVVLRSLEEPDFQSLTSGEAGHWRGDLKWTFGIITAALIFLTLLTAGLYRVTGPGAARQVLVPLIEDSTTVESAVKENYKSLQAKARREKTGSIYIPDLQMTVTLDAGVVSSLSADALTDRVVQKIEEQLYSRGYMQGLPMRAARGAGEERAKATCVTIMSKLNRSTHNGMLMPVIILGVLTLAFGILFMVFCRGWGKVVGAGVAIIAGAIPGSLFLRIGSQFLWKSGVSGTFRPASNQAMRTMGSLAVAYFDIALALGALVLLVGVVASVIARKAKERAVPFTELLATDEPAAEGTPPAPGAGPETTRPEANAPGEEDSFFLS